MPDGLQVLVGEVVVEDEQAAAPDLHVRVRLDQVDAVHGRGGPLVELARNELHGQVALARKGKRIADGVGHPFAEDGVTAFLEERVGEPEQVIDGEQPQGTEGERKVFVELIFEALRLNLELRRLFYENSV